MGFLDHWIAPHDRKAALLLYGMVFCTCFTGYDAGVMTVILADKQFIDYYNLDPNRSGLVATLPWIAIGISQLWLGGTLCSWLGRLQALRISILIMCLGVVIQVVPNNYGVLLAGRLITGIGSGTIYIATNLYITESAPSSMRGSLVGTVAQFGYQFGTMIAFWTGYGMSFHKSPYNIAWRVSNAVQIPIGIVFIAVTYWYPESPRYMLEKHPDDPQRCLHILQRLRQGDASEERIQTEFHDLVASHEYRKRFEPGYLGILKSRDLRKRLLYGFYAMSLQQFGGIAALTMYAALIYESLGWNGQGQALAINGIQSVLQLFIVLVNTFTVDRFGRKTLLIFGFAIQAGALLILSSLTTAYPQNQNRSADIAEIAMFFLVGLTYCWSNGPIPPVIAAEIFPQHVRDKAFGLSVLGQTAWLLALTQPWPQFNAKVGPHSYWLLFGLNLICLLTVVIFLPETKGISLERMDKIFGQVDAVAQGEQSDTTASKEKELLEGVVATKAADCELIEVAAKS